MKLNISRHELARVLTAVGKVIENRNTIPILGHVMLSAKDGKLTVTGTDLDIVATASVATDIATDGTICVDAKLISDIAKKCGADIAISLEADKLVVKSGRSRFSLATLPADDFPTMPPVPHDAEFDTDLAALFAPVRFAISNEATRYYLNGVFFHNVKGRMCAVATDGHRLARHYGDAAEDFPSVIIPAKVVGIVPEGIVHVSVSNRRITITTADMVLASKVIDGTFPDYVRVIPQGNDKVVVVDRDELMRASERVVTISSERGRGVKLSIAPGAIGLSAHSEIGDAQDEVAAEYTGEPFEGGLNSQYVRDMLGAIPSGPVSLRYSDPMSPVLITGANENWDGVLMPMRVA